MKWKLPILTLSVLSVFVAATACNEDRKLTLADQEAAIDTYITQNFADYPVMYRNGLARVNLSDSLVNTLTDSLVYGDAVRFYYAGYVFTNSPRQLFCTNLESLALESNFSTTDADFSAKEIDFTRGCMIEGLVNGMYGVRKGGHYVIFFSAQHGFYNSYMYNVPKMSALAYEVWIEDIIKR